MGILTLSNERRRVTAGDHLNYGDSLPPAVVGAAVRHVNLSVEDVEDTPFVKFKNGTLIFTDLTGPHLSDWGRAES